MTRQLGEEYEGVKKVWAMKRGLAIPIEGEDDKKLEKNDN